MPQRITSSPIRRHLTSYFWVHLPCCGKTHHLGSSYISKPSGRYWSNSKPFPSRCENQSLWKPKIIMNIQSIYIDTNLDCIIHSWMLRPSQPPRKSAISPQRNRNRWWVRRLHVLWRSFCWIVLEYNYNYKNKTSQSAYMYIYIVSYSDSFQPCFVELPSGKLCFSFMLLLLLCLRVLPAKDAHAYHMLLHQLEGNHLQQWKK